MVVVVVIVVVVVVVVVVVAAATAQTLWKFRGGFRTGPGSFPNDYGFFVHCKKSEQPGPNSWTQSLFKTRAHWAGGRVSTFCAVEGVTWLAL